MNETDFYEYDSYATVYRTDSMCLTVSSGIVSPVWSTSRSIMPALSFAPENPQGSSSGKPYTFRTGSRISENARRNILRNAGQKMSGFSLPRKRLPS